MTAATLLRADLQLITKVVPHGARVLDLGCGDGSLMAHLRDQRGCDVRGIELSGEGVAAAIGQGLSVVQDDLDEGLGAYDPGSFDVVVLSQTLQVVRRPAFVLREMLRVGSSAVLTFPNFGHWRVRGYLAFRGRMPVSRSIPYSWYDTPNIHHTTLKDFRDFVAANGGVIEREVPLHLGGWSREAHVQRVLPNLLADTALAVVRKA
ncbi:MAG: methionine biosynthesis protein MetW [Actinomycetota bacterium]|nr:methionine biosynthesis protein MetW [Actinomycetota bacterium]MDZ4180462.1 methionine biosynthesis protein MetW [Coriobacteriia bacterium]